MKMMKLIGSKWKLYNAPPRLFHFSSSSSIPSDSLLLRMSRAGDPNISVTPLLDQWVQEGRDIKHSELQFFVKQLKANRRFHHALEVSEWMSNLVSGDIASRLDLIAHVRGLDQAEKYFSSISDTSRDFKVYGTLLNCYAQHNSVEKAEAIMQKIKEYDPKQVPRLTKNYNTMLRLYARIGQYEKLNSLMQEMKEKNLCDGFSYNIRLNAYLTTNDIDGMEKLLDQLEADPVAPVDWVIFCIAADGFTKAGQFEKSLAMLKKSEKLIKGKMMRVAYESLIIKYAAIGKKDDVYRIWNMCKMLKPSRNSSYISMLTALSELNDIDGAERILEEWESGNTCFDNRIPNVMVSAYCKNGMLEKAEACIARLSERKSDLDGSVWDSLARGYYEFNDMNKAVETMKKAVLAGKQGWRWRPYPFTLAACIEHVKDKGDYELALEILRICREQVTFSAATYDRLLSYMHGEIPETNALNLMKEDYNLKTDEILDGEKQHEIEM
ncbi:Tetratricopeptide-like helical domain superfamily [Sesbania bispinosa]|nr:Tetratricopeptide-like helical domain superfamily [Sesbania bispinosa]